MIRISALVKVASTTKCLLMGIHSTAMRFMGVKGLELRMPALSPTMSSGTIIKWLKKEGDPVLPGDAICEIQTDKAVMTFDVEEEGVLAKIMLPDDSKDVNVGTLIALMVEEGHDWKDVEVPTSTASKSDKRVSVESSTDHDQKQGLKKTDITKVTLGPAVKKLLSEFGIDGTAIEPSGPRGTLLKGDVLKYVDIKKLTSVPLTKSPPATVPAARSSKPTLPRVTRDATAMSEPAVYVDVANSELRKTLAVEAVRSKTRIPHSYCSIDCQVSEAIQLCRTLGVALDGYIIKAAAVALQRVPAVNAKLTGETILPLTHVDVAIDIHDVVDGLRSVVVHDAIGLGVAEISELLGTTDRQGTSAAALEQSAVALTVSNLGPLGVTEFAEIVPEHRTAVLAVGTSRASIDDNGRPVTRLTVTLSYDARVFDEVVAAKFLEQFAVTVADPPRLLLGLGPAPPIRAAAVAEA